MDLPKLLQLLIKTVKLRSDSINLRLFVEEITFRRSHKFSPLLTDLLSPITELYIVHKSMRIRV